MTTTTIDEYQHEKSDLESLPQDVLIKIICGVGHEDLKQLRNVSKSIREVVSTIIAGQLHFAYSTPTKVKAFRTSTDLEEPSELNDVEAPNAPRQWRCIKKRKMRFDEELSESKRSIRKRLQLLEIEESC